MDEAAADWMEEMLDAYRMHLRGEGGLSADEIRKQPEAAKCLDALNREIKWTKRFITMQLGKEAENAKSNTSPTSDIEDVIAGSHQ